MTEYCELVAYVAAAVCDGTLLPFGFGRFWCAWEEALVTLEHSSVAGARACSVRRSVQISHSAHGASEHSSAPKYEAEVGKRSPPVVW